MSDLKKRFIDLAGKLAMLKYGMSFEDAQKKNICIECKEDVGDLATPTWESTEAGKCYASVATCPTCWEKMLKGASLVGVASKKDDCYECDEIDCPNNRHYNNGIVQ